LAAVGLLSDWYDALGVPVLPLGGFSSQTFVDDIVADLDADIAREDRPPVLIYAGDHDRSGHAIQQHMLTRTGDRFAQVIRVAVTEDQIAAYQLPVSPAKPKDKRGGFMHITVQVELEALRPDVLHGLLDQTIARFWNQDAYDAILQQEAEDHAVLDRAAIMAEDA
jgi:hypothetical protein